MGTSAVAISKLHSFACRRVQRNEWFTSKVKLYPGTCSVLVTRSLLYDTMHKLSPHSRTLSMRKPSEYGEDEHCRRMEVAHVMAALADTVPQRIVHKQQQGSPKRKDNDTITSSDMDTRSLTMSKLEATSVHAAGQPLRMKRYNDVDNNDDISFCSNMQALVKSVSVQCHSMRQRETDTANVSSASLGVSSSLQTNPMYCENKTQARLCTSSGQDLAASRHAPVDNKRSTNARPRCSVEPLEHAVGQRAIHETGSNLTFYRQLNSVQLPSPCFGADDRSTFSAEPSSKQNTTIAVMSPHCAGIDYTCNKRLLQDMDYAKLPPKKRKLLEGKHRMQLASAEKMNEKRCDGDEVVALQQSSASEADESRCSETRIDPNADDGRGEERVVTSSPAPLTPHCPPERRALLVRQQCQRILQADDDGDLPLHIAVVQGDHGAVKKLLAIMSMMKVSIDQYNNLRQTPLHLAVITREAGLVLTLLAGGASAALPDRHGHTIIHLAVQHASAACLRAMLQPAYLKHADLDAKSYNGLSALHLAVGASSTELVSLLLDAGASVDVIDGKSGRTPLFHAAEAALWDVADVLLRRRAAVGVPSYAGVTAVQAAHGRGHTHMVQLLVKHGADTVYRDAVCVKDKQVKMILHNSLVLKKRPVQAPCARKVDVATLQEKVQTGALDLSAKPIVKCPPLSAGHLVCRPVARPASTEADVS